MAFFFDISFIFEMHLEVVMLRRFLAVAIALTLGVSVNAQDWTTVWEAGTEAPGGWIGNGSGIDFVQEAGVNDPPGDANSPAVNQQADDDFYFAGTYPDPIGTVPQEVAIERAFAGDDNALRLHFNWDGNDADLLRFTTRPFNLHDDGGDTRYGLVIDVNGTEILPEVVVRPGDLGTLLTTAEFSAADVGLVSGAGADNVLTLTGVNYSGDGGGNWMGLDYHHLETSVVPEPAGLAMMFTGFLWALPMMWYEARQARRKNS